MRNRIGQLFVVLAALLAVPALAQQDQAPRKSSPDELAIGLGKLHWGMTMPEARGIDPAFKAGPPDAAAGAASSSLTLDGFSYNGCSFAVGLSFTDGKLVSVSLSGQRGVSTERCADTIRTELEAKYDNVPNHIFYPDRSVTEHFQEMWDGPTTAVEMNTLAPNGALSIHFKKVSAPG